MKRSFGILIYLLLPVAILAQRGSAFRELPTVLPELLEPIDLADLAVTVITEKEFLRLEARSTATAVPAPTIQPDSNGVFVVHTARTAYEFQETSDYDGSYFYLKFIPEVRGHLIGFCGGGACEEYLLDHETDVKLALPADYDQGIMDLLISPAKDRMLVYASYDGPDYTNYYANRATMDLYSIVKEQGVAGLHRMRTIVMDDRSIERIVWKDDRTLALKTYAGPRTGEGFEGGYAYLTVVVE